MEDDLGPPKVLRCRVVLDSLRDQNLKQLKLLNAAIFPIRYQDKFYKAARPPPPQQGVQQGGVDAEEVDQGFFAELEAAGDEGPNEAAELLRALFPLSV